MNIYKSIVLQLAYKANIKVYDSKNGEQDATADIIIFDQSIYKKLIFNSSLTLGEGYMHGELDIPDIENFFIKIVESNLDQSLIFNLLSYTKVIASIFINKQSKERAFEVGEKHYDLGNDLYEATLGPSMVYTSAIYESESETLEEAQYRKIEKLCSKMNIKKDDHILDIGCGWGAFMKYAAKKYDVKATGLTVSVEQTALAKEICKGLPIDFKIMDYRDFEGLEKFDSIVSVEMFEAVGYRNFRIFMQKAHSLIKDDGIFAMQTIGSKLQFPSADPWIDKYIFPNGELPNMRQIEKSVKGLFEIIEITDIGPSYAITLRKWWQNFNENYHKLDKNKYDKTFYLMWKYYLLQCAALFETKKLPDWQIILKKIN